MFWIFSFFLSLAGIVGRIGGIGGIAPPDSTSGGKGDAGGVKMAGLSVL